MKESAKIRINPPRGLRKGQRSDDFFAGPFRAVVYDCDGVLVNSIEANKAYYNHILSHFGLTSLQTEPLEKIQTLTASEVLDHIFENIPQLVEKAHVFEKSLNNEQFIPLTRLEPHLKEVLQRLRPAFITAVVSNRGKSLLPLLRYHHLEDSFDMIIGSLDVSRPKPDPEGLEKVINLFNIAPNEVLFVGDAKIDFTLAERACVPFSSYKNSKLNALYHLDDHRELIEILLPEGFKKPYGEVEDG